MIKKNISKANIFKFVGLIIFLVVLCVIVWLVWPYIGKLFVPGGLEEISQQVRNAGPIGVVILLALQFLQVVVAFIPGEVVQIAAGAMYGPWIGALLLIIGCIVSSAFIFIIVKKFGAPFVQEIVSTKYLDKLKSFEKTEKFDAVIFILFLIPGLPKDVFSYLVPLFDIGLGRYLLLSSIGRFPGIFLSTFAANSLIVGDYVTSAIVFLVAAAIAVIGIVFCEKLLNFLDKRTKERKLG